jgi:hypothetical protein
LALPKHCKSENLCLTAITVEDVLDEVNRVIGSRPVSSVPS